METVEAVKYLGRLKIDINAATNFPARTHENIHACSRLANLQTSSRPSAKSGDAQEAISATQQRDKHWNFLRESVGFVSAIVKIKYFSPRNN